MGPDGLAPGPQRVDARRSRGTGIAVLAASMFSVGTVMARLAFDGGMDAPTANAARFLFAILVLCLFFVLRRRLPSLPARHRVAALALGIPVFVTTFGFLDAIQYIPVSVAVLALYTYPVLVGLIAWLAGREPLGPIRLAALALAFGGLVLALDIQAAVMPDWRGLALALLAAASMSVMVVGGSRVMREADPSVVNLHLLATASALFVIVLLVGDGPHWPSTEDGRLAAAGLLVAFAAGQLSLIAAIARAGPVLAATIMNLEPLITIALAVLLVGERLTALQALGAGLVIAAILLVSRTGRPAAPSTGEP